MAVVVITGCSSGFGRLAAVEMARRGDVVFASMRDLSKADGLRGDADEAGVSLEIVELDVTNRRSVDAAVSQVLAKAGRVDVVVNNAGIGLWSPVECYSDEEMGAAFETNVFGVHRVTRAVLPAMRKQRSGMIVLISSVSGFFTWPFGGVYCATKHAAEALYDALYFELRPFGIQVVIIEPGDFATEVVKNAHITSAWTEKVSDPAYVPLARAATRNQSAQEDGDATVVARLIADVAHEARPERRYLVGDGAIRSAQRTPAELERDMWRRVGYE
ncbi:MAG: SDR family oxidoreductase [Chloroflexota bacterium]|nr:SDR family oxidoreductase [Chloroflexota bacterium]